MANVSIRSIQITHLLDKPMATQTHCAYTLFVTSEAPGRVLLAIGVVREPYWVAGSFCPTTRAWTPEKAMTVSHPDVIDFARTLLSLFAE